ncbi:MAG TPA: thioredoxin-disulfide reductase [Spirochaetia bacterium]|nr:thioredoxin-disulfide reductase [Spirochaetia bacterium]
MSGAVKKSEIKKVFLENYRLKDKTAGIQRKTIETDLAIIGAGPAGLTAGIYASRAKIKTLVIDQGNPGGQVNITHLVANYPGTGKEIQGFMLMHHMSEQAKLNGVEFLSASEIMNLDLANKTILVDDDKKIVAKAIIIATGSKPRKLGIEGEDRFAGNGISYCATCDGKFYEGKKLYVIGGGNSAVEESLYLTEFVKELTIIHQFDEFQANQTAIEEALANPKIKVLFSHEPRKFIGEKGYEKLEVEDLKTGERKVLSDADGVFIFIGYQPQNELFKNQLNLNQWGYIPANEKMETEIPGVFAAGDIKDKQYRQITTAVSDGTIASLNAEKYIRGLKK